MGVGAIQGVRLSGPVGREPLTTALRYLCRPVQQGDGNKQETGIGLVELGALGGLVPHSKIGQRR
jgi:hypothetical protein